MNKDEEFKIHKYINQVHRIIQMSLFLMLLATMLVFTPKAYAGRLYLFSEEKEFSSGNPFTLQLRLDTQDDEINAVEVSVRFRNDLLEFKNGYTGGSIVDLWVEEPRLAPCQNIDDEECSLIKLAGVVPGGFSGEGIIAEFIFQAKEEGLSVVRIDPSSRVLLNSPDGTSVFLVYNDAEISIGSAGEIPKEIVLLDKRPPDLARAHIERMDDMFENRWFLSFSAQDGETGVVRYEVRELLFGVLGFQWREAKSPFVLSDQYLMSAIQVRVTDHAGNISSSTVIPTRLYVLYFAVFVSLILLLAIFIARHFIRKLPIL